MNILTSNKNTYNREQLVAEQPKVKMYVTSGEKCKIIGTQDGLFPDFGHHIKNEMGGLWIHPIKILDGFWATVNGNLLTANTYDTLEYGTKFTYLLDSGLVVKRFQFCPISIKGAVIKYSFENMTGSEIEFDFDFYLRSDIQMVWNPDEVTNNPDTVLQEEGNVIIKNKNENFCGAICSNFFGEIETTTDDICPEKTIGNGTSIHFKTPKFSILPFKHTEISYYVAGSTLGEEDAKKQLYLLTTEESALIFEKLEKIEKIKNSTKLSTDSAFFDEVFKWVKINTDYHMLNCDGIGRGYSAGIPEYIWWFGCDNSYSTQGITEIGDFQGSRDTLALVRDYSIKQNGNGRVVHEITTAGQVTNDGNTQETAHYIAAVYKYFLWTGDIEFLKETYDFLKMGINWLESMDEDGDMLPSGYGICEIKGLNLELIDTITYTCQAYFCMHEMSKVLCQEDKTYLEKGEKLKKIINTNLWNDTDKLFVDAMGTPRQLLDRIGSIKEDCIKKSNEDSEEFLKFLNSEEERIKKLPPDEDIPLSINQNWVIAVPIETSLADEDKAKDALDVINTNRFIGRYGAYLLGREHTHAMTISTGVYAVANGRYGNSDAALDILERMNNAFGLVMPGAISEMLPDYGCFVQEWTVYSYVVPVVECFAGLNPNAYTKKIVIKPNIPTKWNHFKLENIRIGNNMLDIVFERYKDYEKYIISSKEDWEISFEADGKKIFLGENEAKYQENKIKLGKGLHVIIVK